MSAEKNRETNKKILKFGCFPIAMLFVLVFIFSLGDSDSETPIKTSSEKSETKSESPEELKSQLIREIESINTGINFSGFRGDIDAIQMEIVLFKAWDLIIGKGESFGDSTIIILTNELSNKSDEIKKSEFPKIRKEYAKVVSEKLWEEDIYVTASGKDNTVINFTGGVFAANKNKKEFQDQVAEILKEFGFEQARYRWYKGANDYTTFALQ